MTDTEIELAGKMSAVEFILEIMLANMVAQWSEADTEEYFDALLGRRDVLRTGPVSVDLMTAVSEVCGRELEFFRARVTARAKHIRE